MAVAGIFEGKISGENNSKMILISDGDLVINDGQSQIKQGNFAFAINAINWLSGSATLLELQSKGAIQRPINQVEEENIPLLKYLNFFLPIFLILIYGFINNQRNKNIRLKRMSVSYE